MTKEKKFILMELYQSARQMQNLIEQLLGEESVVQENELSMSEEERKEFQKLIAMQLKMMGMPAHLGGYKAFKIGVEMVIEDKEYLHMLTKSLYPDIAKKMNSTASRVERAMRHAIEVVWLRGNLSEVDKIFGYAVSAQKDRPAVGEFMATLADYIETFYS